MKRFFAAVPALFLAFFLIYHPSASAVLKLTDIPEALQSWIGWVLHGQEEGICSFLSGKGEERLCLWPGRLELTLDGNGGHFSQSWQVEADGWALLPGGPKFWPQNVKTEAGGLPVVERDGEPAVYLAKGYHAVSGDYFWDQLPESFPIPPRTGLVSVVVNGSPLDFLQRDEEGRLWIAKTAGRETGEEENLDIHVFRRVTDDIPLILTTRIDLTVSGKNREIQLDRVLPDGFIAMSLEGELSARLEKDGKLLVQVRAGTWTTTLTARHESAANAILLGDLGRPVGAPVEPGLMPAEEVWVFEARPSLRLVEVSGVPVIDPRQTTLPADWMGLPTYAVKPGDTFQIVQKKRGDEDPSPDDLTLARTLWLDFDGTGFTVHDELTGLMRRGWRLEMNAPVQLGRVSIDGEDQFITRLKGSGREGVEVRQGKLSVQADSRLPRKGAFSAVGWSNDFQHLSAVLNLPPGWRLFGATGIDKVRHTWLNQWTLLDLFVVLMTALAVAKLFGVRWGIVALITLMISYKEVGAPRWIWLMILAGETLCRYLPTGRIRFFFSLYRLGTWLALVVIAVPFLIQQVRQGIHPALEQIPSQYRGAYDEGQSDMGYGAKAPPPAPPQDLMVGGMESLPVQMEESLSIGRIKKTESSRQNAQQQMMKQKLLEQDPNALVQTGPGLTNWEWSRVAFAWSGPVASTQKIHLILIPPWMNLILSLSRVVLLALLVLCLFGYPLKRLMDFIRRRPMGLAGFLVGMMIVTGSISAARADYPSDALLQTLKDRLIENPECYPDCASISRMQLEIAPATLRARMEINAAADTALAIPGNLKDWSPQNVVIDGEANAGIIRSDDGLLWLMVKKGTHQVLLSGVLPKQNSVRLALPEKPHRVEVITRDGWTVDGIQSDGIPEENLTLTRTSTGSADTLTKGGEVQQLPPFVRVERTFYLGLEWEIETRVVRLTPTGTPIVVEVPLVEGESVTTPDVVVRDGKVNASLGTQMTEVSWRSHLEIAPELVLKAPEAFSWATLWRVEAGPVWHVEATGIPPIHDAASTEEPQRGPSSGRVPQWQPWPGESLKLAISRPEGVLGQTMTIDKSILQVTPGRRTSDITLNLDLRSSLGAQHALSLPKEAVVKTLTINGTDHPIRMEREKLIIPLTPGSQTISVSWLDRAGFSFRYQVPAIHLGTPSVNAETKIKVGADRWILSLGGPRLGPAVLFWSTLVVIILVGLSLSKLDFSPLTIIQWVLLGLGLTQVSVGEALAVAGWLLFLGWRKKKSELKSPFLFDMRQLLIVLWTIGALVILVDAIRRGLLGAPDMQIAGNHSTSYELNWYQDRTDGALPRSWVISVPLYVYHLAMLAWAMWLALALIRWFRFGWNAFSEGGLWRPLLKKKAV